MGVVRVSGRSTDVGVVCGAGHGVVRVLRYTVAGVVRGAACGVVRGAARGVVRDLMYTDDDGVVRVLRRSTDDGVVCGAVHGVVRVLVYSSVCDARVALRAVVVGDYGGVVGYFGVTDARCVVVDG